MDESRLIGVLDRLDRGQQEHRRETLDFRIAVMARFERLEDKVSGLATSVALNVELDGGILDQLTARAAQLAMLQGAIRAGINAEVSRSGRCRGRCQPKRPGITVTSATRRSYPATG